MRITRCSRLQPIATVVRVEAVCVRGITTEAQLVEWLQHAVEYYHTFRAGHVGSQARSTIQCPKIRRMPR